MTVIEKYKAIQNMGTSVEVPHEVWTLFGDKCKNVEIIGDQICLGEDFASLLQARKAVEWYTKQLGGQIKWAK